MAEQSSNPVWAKRWTFIMATTGAAVGLGNIWKFPYITGENGGGAFVLVYLVCILLFGIPVMMAETMLGRKGRENPVHAMLKHSRAVDANKAWTFIGIMGVAAGIMILMYYSVVAGWSLEYVLQSLNGNYMGKTPNDIANGFSEFSANPQQQLMWHSIFMFLTTVIVSFGVRRGIGNAVNILMPALFIILLILLVYSYQYGAFEKGFNFMFNTDFSKLSRGAILIAMGHAFFTISLGMGTVMVYGSYMPSDSSIAGTIAMVAFLDTLIAIIAGLTIFPIVFASGLLPGSGPGLLFETLPIAFSTMWNGSFFGVAFFLLITIAALSSSISLIEPGIAWLERIGINRLIATIGLGLFCWGGGVASIYSEEVFGALDYITANIMLPLGGLLIAIFTGWVFGYTRVRKEINDISSGLFNIWFIILRFVAPIGITIVFINALGLFS